jgi:NAD(P)-dependent dehydrogenase (short-subunit alcohol dehydrogenase family)
MDVGDENSVSDGFFKAAASIGKLDIVVNNAGIGDVASR